MYDKTAYSTAMQKVTITCVKHGDFLQRPNDHTSGGNGCPACKSDSVGSHKRTSHENVITSFLGVHGVTYDYSRVSYVNMKRKVEVTCRTHGRFLISPEKHILGQGCASCNISSGEAMVATALTELGIPFVREKAFEGLNGQSSLRFGFFLPTINALVEYDGEQHSMLSKVFRSGLSTDDEVVARFLKTVEYDCLKNSFANTHQMYLLRIPYTTKTPSSIRKTLIEFVETVECDPESLDSSGSSGSYVMA